LNVVKRGAKVREKDNLPFSDCWTSSLAVYRGRLIVEFPEAASWKLSASVAEYRALGK
jgi:hypothetical protein